MAKKKKTAASTAKEFNRNPFSDLEGFTGSGREKEALTQSSPKVTVEKVFGSFAEEMEMLGVRKLSGDQAGSERSDGLTPQGSAGVKLVKRTEEDVFLEAMSDLQVRFEDHLPEAESRSAAPPRRMRQLKQGRQAPDATLDLHGFQRSEVIGKMGHFLENARHNGWNTLLVITGKGLHSEGGEPVIRDEVERFLTGEGQRSVVEWGRAPKQYGGDGALVLFMRKK